MAIIGGQMSCQRTQAAVIYRETFGIAPGATVDSFATAFDWQRFDNNGAEITTTGTSSGVNYTVNGRPIDVANVNAGPNNDGTFDPYANGILYLGATPSPSLAFTTEFTVDPTNYLSGSLVFSWYEGNNTAPHTFRLLVRVGGSWYASATTFTTPATALANFGTDAQLKTITYDPAPANWLKVNFDGDYILGATPGTGTTIPSTLGALALGSAPTAPLSGAITAFGVYGDNGGSATGNRRIDSFTIEAATIPIVTSKTATWQGLSNGDWDLVTPNWKANTGAATTYADGDIARFDDTAATGNVNLLSLLFPGSLTVSNETRTYNFAGGGAISGKATLAKQGASSLILANAGNNNFTGGISIGGGTLQVGDGGTNGNLGAANITNNAALVINRSDSLILANSISGSGTLTKSGDGSLVLSGSNSYKGSTLLNGGSLVLNGLLSGGGSLSTTAGTILTGSGTNTGPVIVGGQLNPGAGVGTFTAGGLTLNAGATNVFELSTTNAVGGNINDLIQVNGNLTLNNNTVSVTLSGPPQTGVPYRLINYTGTRAGAFNPTVMVTGAVGYTAALNYDDSAKLVNLTFTAPASQAAVIYRETFGIAPGATVDSFATAFDWQRFDNNGAEITTTGTSSGVNYTVNGRPIDVSNVNAGPNNDGTFGPYANGILYLGATPSPSLAFTTEYTVDPTKYVPGSIVFSWYEGNNTAPHAFRLLVRVGGLWYASATTFTTPATALANFGTDAQLKTMNYNPAPANWLQVNFDGDYVPGATPGTGTTIPSTLGALALGSSPSTPLSGSITAFGVYGDNGGSATGNRRIDSFNIEAMTAAPVTPPAQPKFGSINLESGNLVLRAASGTPNGTLSVLVSTNLVSGSANWTSIATGKFDANGNFAVTNVFNTAVPQQYYKLQVP